MPLELPSIHVLMVIESDYPSMVGGGAEAQIETLTRHRPADLDVTVVAPLVPYGPAEVDDIVHGVPVHRLHYPRLPLIGGLIMLARLALFILARRQGLHAIHCHIAHNMAAVCSGLGALLGIPVVVKLTGMFELDNGILSDNRSWALGIKRWLIKRASAVQAISAELEAGLIRKGFDKTRIHLIPNAVDTSLFAPAVEDREDLKQRIGIEAAFVACFVGRLVPEKALDLSIRAWDRRFRRRRRRPSFWSAPGRSNKSCAPSSPTSAAPSRSCSRASFRTRPRLPIIGASPILACLPPISKASPTRSWKRWRLPCR